MENNSFVTTNIRKKKEFEELERESKNCQRCKLYKGRTNVVFGKGSIDTRILFIGEGPGFNEDKKGIPFCGKAGEILDLLLSSINLKRDDVYITNIVKCRPPNNRDPEDEEIKSCSYFLSKQIELIKPEIIVPLGRHSMREIFNRFSIDETGAISKVHGNIYEKKGVFILPLYHPAVAVYNPDRYLLLKKDFEKIRELIERKKYYNKEGEENGYLF